MEQTYITEQYSVAKNYLKQTNPANLTKQYQEQQKQPQTQVRTAEAAAEAGSSEVMKQLTA